MRDSEGINNPTYELPIKTRSIKYLYIDYFGELIINKMLKTLFNMQI